MNKKTSRYLIAALIPMLILVSMVMPSAVTKAFGEEIQLKTITYDPRDLFRGDYVTLRYEINRVKIDLLSENLRLERKGGETYWGGRSTFSNNSLRSAYAVLRKNGDFYEVEQITEKKPFGKLFLNCEVSSYYDWPESLDKTVYVEYNLGKFFVPEGTGMKLEKASREGALTAKVKVLNGFGVLTDVFFSE